ncbi:hypothetical protein C5O19_15485 [Siphonobacter curvatus]|uniref:Uncharacterized protein n=2 Tax=Siphonobacter curvatus TaxID=2094562 RepID=A0A2S7IJK1_9BACT|nr:hypothetical protein C5O19_15485 [Siphonobacter curvatus]
MRWVSGKIFKSRTLFFGNNPNAGLTFAAMPPFIKSISVVFLTGLLLVRTLVVPMVFLDFSLRQEYIKTYLCENRSRPELHCDGTCYLAKKLKATQESEEKQASQRFLSQLLEMPAELSELAISFKPSAYVLWQAVSAPAYACFFPSSLPTGIFRPPKLLSFFA